MNKYAFNTITLMQFIFLNTGVQVSVGVLAAAASPGREGRDRRLDRAYSLLGIGGRGQPDRHPRHAKAS
ncbi:hypothetical protein LJK87_48180 [Paenibacillus sp. P25]|nr:hypothetical protein LJK87_48180 [Paenibacillus sp. P25]